MHDERTKLPDVVRFCEDEEAGENGERELVRRAEGEGVEVLQKPLDDCRGFWEVEGARSESEVGGGFCRRAREGWVDRRRRLNRRVGVELLRLSVEPLLLRRDDPLGAKLELVHLAREPGPAVVEELARAPESATVGTDDLEVGEEGLG